MTRKKKKSRITMPKDGQTKPTLHAFRADRSLTKLLNGVPDKSEFITKALMDAFGRDHYVTCAACQGSGKVHRKGVA